MAAKRSRSFNVDTSQYLFASHCYEHKGCTMHCPDSYVLAINNIQAQLDQQEAQ